MWLLTVAQLEWIPTNLNIQSKRRMSSIMGRIEGIIPDDLETRLRIEVVKRYGGKKGDLVKGIIEAIRLWVDAPIAEKLADVAKNNSNTISVQTAAIETLEKMGYPALPYLADIANKSDLTVSVQSKALAASRNIMSQ